MVEQGTHKPLVGSSTLPPGTFSMAWVYILRGSSGRHYIGSTVDLESRFAQHLKEAREIEQMLKAKKNPKVAIHYLQH